jgi:hypothetical protein
MLPPVHVHCSKYDKRKICSFEKFIKNVIKICIICTDEIDAQIFVNDKVMSFIKWTQENILNA